MFDIIIRNGQIIDGTANDSYVADIGIIDDTIVEIGDLKSKEAKITIDANEKMVTPGFIDMHSHGDGTILAYPKAESHVKQGVTTIVCGQCGASSAPMEKYWLFKNAEIDLRNDLSEDIFYSELSFIELEKIKDHLRRVFGYEPDWKTFGDFLEKIEKQGISANYISHIGHGTVRLEVMGPDHKRKATKEEIEKMKYHINEAMEAGAIGMSVGLDYPPGAYADFDELLELAKELKKYDGIYTAHWRKTGLREGTPKNRQQKIAGIIETLEIAKQANIQGHLSHLSIGYDVFPANDAFMMKASAQRTLQVIDQYLNEGVNAAFDVIPNDSGGTIMDPDLVCIFQPWLRLFGSIEQFIKNINAPDFRNYITEYIYSGKYYELNPFVSPDWDEFITIIRCKNKKYENKTIYEISKVEKRHPLDTVFDILTYDPKTKMRRITQSIHMSSIQEFLNHPQATVGIDTLIFNLNPTMKYDGFKSKFLPNPITYCGFIKYIKELKMPRVEDTIRKITGKPSDILKLKDRGYLKKGYKADIAILDYDNLKTNENYIDSRIYPEGIEYVLVNGEIVVNEGKHTGKLPGQVLRRK